MYRLVEKRIVCDMKNQKLIQFLNQLLSNYFVMYVKLHRYHWYVQGEQFFQLHQQFEDMYKTFGQDLDMIAERILMIDGQPLDRKSTRLNSSHVAISYAVFCLK